MIGTLSSGSRTPSGRHPLASQKITVRRRRAPAIIGRKEAARILGIKPENIGRIVELPEPLQERGIEGFEVSTGPLWPLAEIRELAAKRAARAKALAAARAKTPAGRARASAR